jgi:hypothetical protein
MRRLTLLLLLFACALLTAPAHAGSDPQSPEQLWRSARTAVIVPVEWDGVWNSVDTVYTCAGVPQSTNASSDTVCGGKDYSPNSPTSPIVFVCTGTADATSFNMTCTASQDIFPNCTADYTIVTHGTRTGDTSYIVSTVNVTYSGTGPGCSLLTPSCSQSNSVGTRIGPAPSAFCTTPVRTSTWGRVKYIYR